MIEAIKDLDLRLFIAMNGSNSSFWDAVMYWISTRWIWIPLYFVLFIMVFVQMRNRTGLVLLITACMVLCTDQSANLFKNSFIKRYRPCHNLEIQSQVKLNGECGGQYGFVSSHAANSFGLAVFLLFLFRHKMRYAGILLLLWATFVSYSRIYNGVHYPFDVLGGALLGAIIGWLAYRVFRKLELKTLSKS